MNTLMLSAWMLFYSVSFEHDGSLTSDVGTAEFSTERLCNEGNKKIGDSLAARNRSNTDSGYINYYGVCVKVNQRLD